MSQLLLVDDDIELCEMLQEYFGPLDFEVSVANDGESGVEMALSGDYEAVLLDVMLPRLSGFDVLKKIREYSNMPVIMLTARGDDVDRIIGLEMGADDYLPKPFNPRELLARIRAVTRRFEVETPSLKSSARILAAGGVTINLDTRTVSQLGQVIDLTSTEFSLLMVLVKRAGSAVAKDVLFREALGRELGPYDRSIDMHISKIRKKLHAPASGPSLIDTIRGVGYQLNRAR